MQEIFRSITAIFNEIDADPQAREAVMFAAWTRAAGPQLAMHAVPIGYVNKRLKIAVSGVRWKQQMEQLGPQMVFRLNGAFGAKVLNFIEFVVDEAAVAKHNSKKHPPAKLTDSNPELPKSLIDAAAAIHDLKLREDFLGAARACSDRPSRIEAKR
ncbi:MAG: DciA family protein [Pyrinomonadaceae bacterium]